MPYLAELDNSFSCVVGESPYLLDVIAHDWRTLYPAASETAQLDWDEAGEGRPDFAWWPEMRDWVCTDRAFNLVKQIFATDVHEVGSVKIGSEQRRVIQVVGLADVVDIEASLVDRYPTYEILQFPTFRRSLLPAINARLFRE